NADSGTEIHSIHHGRVVFADYMRGYGLLVIVDHEDGYMTLYGHNQSLFVEPGDWVSPGDQLALVGNTGGLAEPGLYFEIRQNGKPVDPASWCTRGS
ncbi:MAG: peptidoglycan DD-metalloendopeptidase family protein, partial [Pseudomonadales bacterium]